MNMRQPNLFLFAITLLVFSIATVIQAQNRGRIKYSQSSIKDVSDADLSMHEDITPRNNRIRAINIDSEPSTSSPSTRLRVKDDAPKRSENSKQNTSEQNKASRTVQNKTSSGKSQSERIDQSVSRKPDTRGNSKKSRPSSEQSTNISSRAFGESSFRQLNNDQPSKIQFPTKVERRNPHYFSKKKHTDSANIIRRKLVDTTETKVGITTTNPRGRSRNQTRPYLKTSDEKPTKGEKIIATIARLNWRNTGKTKIKEKRYDVNLDKIEDENYPEHFKLLLRQNQENSTSFSKTNQFIESGETVSLSKPRRTEPYRVQPTQATKIISSTLKATKKPGIDNRTINRARTNHELQFQILKAKSKTSNQPIKYVRIENEFQEEPFLSNKESKFSTRFSTESAPFPKLPSFISRHAKSEVQIKYEPVKQIEAPRVRSTHKVRAQKFSSRYKADGTRSQNKFQKNLPVYIPTIPTVTTESAVRSEWSNNHPPIMFGSYYPDERIYLVKQLHDYQHQQQPQLPETYTRSLLKNKMNHREQKQQKHSHGRNYVPSSDIQRSPATLTSFATMHRHVTSSTTRPSEKRNLFAPSDLRRERKDLWSILNVQQNWQFNRIAHNHHPKPLI